MREYRLCDVVVGQMAVVLFHGPRIGMPEVLGYNNQWRAIHDAQGCPGVPEPVKREMANLGADAAFGHGPSLMPLAPKGAIRLPEDVLLGRPPSCDRFEKRGTCSTEDYVAGLSALRQPNGNGATITVEIPDAHGGEFAVACAGFEPSADQLSEVHVARIYQALRLLDVQIAVARNVHSLIWLDPPPCRIT